MIYLPNFKIYQTPMPLKEIYTRIFIGSKSTFMIDNITNLKGIYASNSIEKKVFLVCFVITIKRKLLKKHQSRDFSD